MKRNNNKKKHHTIIIIDTHTKIYSGYRSKNMKKNEKK